MNCSPDPFPDQPIFGSPNLSFSVSPPPFVSNPSCSAPVVTLPGLSASSLHFGTLSINSPALDCPPLSPGTLHLLDAVSPPSPLFEPNPPEDILHLSSSTLPQYQARTEAADHTTSGPSNLGYILSLSTTNSSSRCFETPVIRVKSVSKFQQDGHTPSDPLQDHPSVPQTCKQKVKCVKVSSKDFTIRFSEGLSMGEVAEKANFVLVGYVRGRDYSMERLILWVQEIWGNTLKELLEVQILPRGWFALQFSKEEYTNLVLARYWHIEMALSSLSVGVHYLF